MVMASVRWPRAARSSGARDARQPAPLGASDLARGDAELALEGAGEGGLALEAAFEGEVDEPRPPVGGISIRELVRGFAEAALPRIAHHRVAGQRLEHAGVVPGRDPGRLRDLREREALGQMRLDESDAAQEPLGWIVAGHWRPSR
jgi:hypothetical protein